jgi:hypothetical protein
MSVMPPPLVQLVPPSSLAHELMRDGVSAFSGLGTTAARTRTASASTKATARICSAPIVGVATTQCNTPLVVCRMAPSDCRSAQPTAVVNMCRLTIEGGTARATVTVGVEDAVGRPDGDEVGTGAAHAARKRTQGNTQARRTVILTFVPLDTLLDTRSCSNQDATVCWGAWTPLRHSSLQWSPRPRRSRGIWHELRRRDRCLDQ